MTLEDRVDAYRQAFPAFRASWPYLTEEGHGAGRRPVLYARWLLGNDYRATSTIYGSYPPSYLRRVFALFPDAPTPERPVLHAFSGSLPGGPYTRLDVNPASGAELVGSVYNVAELTADRFFLVAADPPYSKEDAARYHAPMVNRGRALAALADVVVPGGFLIWFDCCWPMHRKTQWLTVGRIAVTRSTNHRTRDVTIFQRQPE